MSRKVRTEELPAYLGLGVRLIRVVSLRNFFSALAQAASDPSIEETRGTSDEVTHVVLAIKHNALGLLLLRALAGQETSGD